MYNGDVIPVNVTAVSGFVKRVVQLPVACVLLIPVAYGLETPLAKSTAYSSFSIWAKYILIVFSGLDVYVTVFPAWSRTATKPHLDASTCSLTSLLWLKYATSQRFGHALSFSRFTLLILLSTLYIGTYYKTEQ